MPIVRALDCLKPNLSALIYQLCKEGSYPHLSASDVAHEPSYKNIKPVRGRLAYSLQQIRKLVNIRFRVITAWFFSLCTLKYILCHFIHADIERQISVYQTGRSGARQQSDHIQHLRAQKFREMQDLRLLTVEQVEQKCAKIGYTKSEFLITGMISNPEFLFQCGETEPNDVFVQQASNVWTIHQRLRELIRCVNEKIQTCNNRMINDQAVLRRNAEAATDKMVSDFHVLQRAKAKAAIAQAALDKLCKAGFITRFTADSDQHNTVGCTSCDYQIVSQYRGHRVSYMSNEGEVHVPLSTQLLRRLCHDISVR